MWADWIRSKFDTVLLLITFFYLLHFADMDMHKEVLGALLLALTGARGAAATTTTTAVNPTPAPAEGQKANLTK